MDLASLLGLNTSKSTKAISGIQNNIQTLFQMRAQDQAREKTYYQELAKMDKREADDIRRQRDMVVQKEKAADKMVRDAQSEGGSQDAGMLAGGLLAASLLGRLGGLKRLGSGVFGSTSRFTKEFTKSFTEATKKVVKTKPRTAAAAATATTTAAVATGSARSAKPKDAAGFYKAMGITPEQWKTYSQTVASIETQGYSTEASYKAIGGSGGRYDGRYQMGAAAKKDAARLLGIGVPSRSKFRASPQLQEDMFLAYTYANSTYLNKGSNVFRNADPISQLQYLGYAHNQGWSHAAKWLKTGVVSTTDGFGTKGTKFTDKLAKTLSKYKKRQGGGVVRMNDDMASPQPGGGNKLDGLNAGKGDRSRRIFLHWTAGTYNKAFDNYHTVFYGSGKPIRQTAYDKDKNKHTAGANTNSIGLSLAAMHGGNEGAARKGNMGMYPPTDNQIKSMAMEIARIAHAWGWSAADIDKNVMTHGEWERYATSRGILPGRPQRWDLDILKGGDAFGSGGPKIRAMAKSIFGQLAENPEVARAGAPAEYANPENNAETNDGQTVSEEGRDERQEPVESPQGIAQEMLKYGVFGKVVLQIVKDASEEIGFDLFGVGNLSNLEGEQKPTLSAAPAVAVPSGDNAAAATPTPEATGEDTQATKITIEKNLVQATHADTGRGWTINGLYDYKKRPAVFSKAAAARFGIMQAASLGKITGKDISSSQRSRAKNDSLAGAHPNSSHLYGEALDVVGDTMTWMKTHGEKFGWHWGYNHGANSAHFNYRGPRKIEGLQGGGVVGMQGGGSIGAEFNARGHRPNKYQRPVVIVQRKQLGPVGGNKQEEIFDNSNHRESASVLSTSIYKVYRGSKI